MCFSPLSLFQFPTASASVHSSNHPPILRLQASKRTHTRARAFLFFTVVVSFHPSTSLIVPGRDRRMELILGAPSPHFNVYSYIIWQNNESLEFFFLPYQRAPLRAFKVSVRDKSILVFIRNYKDTGTNLQE